MAVLTLSLGFSGALIAFLFKEGLSLFAIQGNSMAPTLQAGDSIILRQAPRIGKGQLVFFRKPSTWETSNGEETVMVKRVAAVPGDTLTFDGKEFRVNDEVSYVLPEGYSCTAAPQYYQVRLNASQIFVLGDNAQASVDSRYEFCRGNLGNIFIGSLSVLDYGHVVAKF